MYPTLSLLPKSLSPYAQALKHVALRGGPLALGRSAKESELVLFKKGLLPVDYRPMVQGKWDDTVERWAHAWQFPSEDDGDLDDKKDLVQIVSQNHDCIQKLLDFGARIGDLRPLNPKSLPREIVAAHCNQETVTPDEPPVSSSPSVLESRVESFSSDFLSSYPSINTFQKPLSISYELAGIPSAYIDDNTECAIASKKLCEILENVGLDYTEDGITVAIGAMAVAGLRSVNTKSTFIVSSGSYFKAARAILDFASSLGLGPTAEMYKALMRHASCSGDTQLSMSIIEEMKENGITPRIGNWHELMRSFYKVKDYGSVVQIVDNMKMYANIEPNEVTFALQLRALAKDHATEFNALAEAVQLFDQMEQVYGFVPSRPHYDALMFALSQSPVSEMRLRCQELARKMEVMGIPWNGYTFLNLIRSAQVVGDVDAVEQYLGKMRERGIPVTMIHLAWAIHAHVQKVKRQFQDIKEEGSTPVLEEWKKTVEKCLGIYKIVRERGWEVQVPFLNALLRLCCQCAILSTEQQLKSTESNIEKTSSIIFEDIAQNIWEQEFKSSFLSQDSYSYECYITLLAHQQRIDEAETLFQKMLLQGQINENVVGPPSRRTYESLILMHLSSGEEGGAARALHYLQAMERAGLPVRPSLLKKMVRVHGAAGYRRDMKRRARRIMQAREEYMARKAENDEENITQPHSVNSERAEEHNGNPNVLRGTTGITPSNASPLSSESAFSWWEQWRANSVSKHELFEEECEDGTPKGSSFNEKNIALSKMGIESLFKNRSDIPHSSFSDPSSLVAQLRSEEGEVAGSLWSLDGGDLAYPKDSGGPEGWGVKLWRERRLIKKEFQKVGDGRQPVPSLSEAGNAVRLAGDQIDIELSKAKAPGELSDWRRYEAHRYDDGSSKPSGEMAVLPSPPSFSSELVWQNERQDPLSPYKNDEELAIGSDNMFYDTVQKEANVKSSEVVRVLQERRENDVDVKGKGTTRRSKYDYLQKWREMYNHGTLDASDLSSIGSTSLLQFGRSPENHKESLTETIKNWHCKNKKRIHLAQDKSRKYSLCANDNARERDQRIGELGEVAGRRKRLIRPRK